MSRPAEETELDPTPGADGGDAASAATEPAMYVTEPLAARGARFVTGQVGRLRKGIGRKQAARAEAKSAPDSAAPTDEPAAHRSTDDPDGASAGDGAAAPVPVGAPVA